ncbi:hypothetical protein [Tautonia plasticadhaerens]|uniref:Uncharacterized protein n=1 Tax=Tautonia plasticadhaerens TaxID=2527974 RepID=A0A518H6M4_9BACT|nr:hypothetical protein [Tautonia plasticadhaerens]QDV36501.1 hypothetical protein ElP_44270 [Tautonia plasticadhaerens]
MPTLSNDPEASWAGTALSGVTAGSLLTIWSGLWLAFLSRNEPEHSFWTYLAAGCLLTGLAFFGGGLSMGLVRRHTEDEAEQA